LYRPGRVGRSGAVTVTAVYVLAMELDVRIASAHSLKDKRHVVKSIVEGARHRFAISAAEVGAQESWQRGRLGFAVVASSAHQAESVMDDVDRFVWSRPDVEIVGSERTWLE